MTRWEYLSVKMYEFGSEEAEEKRHNDIWVSEYGLLPLVNKLGEEGWEAVCQVGRDLLLKRPFEGSAAEGRAAVEMDARVRTGR